MTRFKPCERCRSLSAKPRERYCGRCRKVVLKELHQAMRYDELIHVRTLSRPGTELIGRPCRSPLVVAEQGLWG